MPRLMPIGVDTSIRKLDRAFEIMDKELEHVLEPLIVFGWRGHSTCS